MQGYSTTLSLVSIMSWTFFYVSIFVGILVQLGGVSGQECQGLDRSIDVGVNEATAPYTWRVTEDLPVRIDNNELTGTTVNNEMEYSYAFPIGVTTVSVFNPNPGTEVICSFDVTVLDMHRPNISDCVNGTLLFTESQKVSWKTPTVTDNSGSYTLVQTAGNQQDNEFDVGMTQIVYEARDPSGNIGTCSFVVNVIGDSNALDIMGCPPDEVDISTGAYRVNADIGQNSQVVTWTEPTIVPMQSGTRSSNVAPGEEFLIGSTYVLYNFTSDSDPSVQRTCSFYIIVSRFEDTIPPNITCPNNRVVVGDLNSPTTTVTWESVQPTDNVGVESSIFIPSNGSSFGVGSTTVFFSAQDAAGNQADCTFVVTVLENADLDAPIFRNCPANFDVFVTNRSMSEVVSWSPPTVHDENDETLTSTHTPPVTLSVADSPHIITYTAVDSASNSDTCSFTISVQVDRVAPVMNCNAFPDITRYVREADMHIPTTVSWTEPSPVATDNSGKVAVVRSKTPGSLFLPGERETVEYRATDGAGLVTRCSFTVAVEIDPAPTFQDCIDYHRVTDNSSSTANFLLTPPLAMDEHPSDPNGQLTVIEPTDIPTEFPIGTTTLTWTATDNLGSVTQCNIDVIVSDRQAPLVFGCPVSFEVPVQNSTFRSAEVTWTEPQVQENSGQPFTLRSTISPGSILRPGIYTVRYIAEDSFGNVDSTCSFDITVTDLPGDTTLPELQGCPSNIFTVTLPDLDYNEVNWTPPTATDNEDTNVDLIASHNPMQRFYIGETTVTYTAIDDRNNRQACSFQVIVQDDQNPVFSECPDNVFQWVNPNTVTTLIKLDNVVVTDNSGSVDRDENFQFREMVANSPVHRTLVASDASGNQATCLVVVTIQETSDVFTYPGRAIISEFGGQAAVPTNLNDIQSDLDDHFRCSSLADDFVGIRLLGDPNFNISYELSFYRGSDNNPYSERGRAISRTIETAFVDGLTGTPPRMFPTGNVVQSNTFQLDVCEFRGSFTLVSSSADGSDLNVGPLLVADSVAELTLRELIHQQLDRTYREEDSFVTSVVLGPFSRSTFETNAIVVDFVLEFQDTSLVAPPAETTVQQLFEDQLRFDSTLGQTQLGTSNLFISTAVAFNILRICSVNYCLNGGVCIVDDSFSPVCQCPIGFFGTQCSSTTFTDRPVITVATGGGLSQGAIIGIIAGAVGLLLILLLLACCCCFLLFSSQPKAVPFAGPHVVPYEEPVAFGPPRRPRAIAYSAPPPYTQEEPFVEMLVPEPVQQSSLVSYHGPGYRGGPIIEEIDSYPSYKRPYLDPYF